MATVITRNGSNAGNGGTTKLVIDVHTNGSSGAASHRGRSHAIVVLVLATAALIFMLRWQGPRLRNDMTPVGLGVKFLLVGSVLALIYYPYELFVKGPAAVERAMRIPK